MMLRKRGFLWLGISVGLLLALVGVLLVSRPYQLQGSVIEPPLPAPDFTLTDQNGRPFQLSAQRGRPLLLFFGYTHCPDVCPVTLTEFRSIAQSLGERAAEVNFVFITVDPERDTVELLKEYMGYYNADFIGLTGDENTLQPVWQAYGIFRERREVQSASGYLVDHTARVFLVDSKGNLRATYPFGFEKEKLAQDLTYILDQPEK